MRCMDRLQTLPFEPLHILAMKVDIAHIATQVHENLCVGKTLWDKTLTCEESYQLYSSFDSALIGSKSFNSVFLSFEYIFL
jgi:hypothetical protein